MRDNWIWKTRQTGREPLTSSKLTWISVIVLGRSFFLSLLVAIGLCLRPSFSESHLFCLCLRADALHGHLVVNVVVSLSWLLRWWNHLTVFSVVGLVVGLWW